VFPDWRGVMGLRRTVLECLVHGGNLSLECNEVAAGECWCDTAANQRKWVCRLVVVARLEVKMRTGGVTCPTDCSESLSEAQLHPRTQVCRNRRQVRVPRTLSDNCHRLGRVRRSSDAGRTPVLSVLTYRSAARHERARREACFRLPRNVCRN
jgi:hypothetical protein